MILALVCVPPASGQVNSRSKTDWLQQARWGVMTHYLGAPPSSAGGAELTAAAWNRQVDAFDARGLADQLSSVGAKYLLLTIGQNSGHYCSPNATYDKLVGIRPSKCSRRDLVADVAKALKAKGIRLLVYLPSGAPAADPVARKMLLWRWGSPGGWQLPGEPVGGRLAEFQRNWEAIIREWSLRWGKEVSGWWIDGCYFADQMYRFDDEPNFASFARALKAGNPDALVAFNPGVRIPVAAHTRHEDYSAGEVDLGHLAAAAAACRGRWLECEGAEVQFHVLTFLGTSWCTGQGPQWPDAKIIALARQITGKGGAVTFDVPIQSGGLIPGPFLAQLRAIGQAMPSPAAAGDKASWAPPARWPDRREFSPCGSRQKEAASASRQQAPPLFETHRPDWEIKFADVDSSVLSVMPGESPKTFFDPLIRREIKWEQDVYCPTFTVFGGRLYCVYRAFGDDSQWRFGLAWSDDGRHFTRSEKPVLYARPEDSFLGRLRSQKDASVSYEDAKIYADENGTFYLFFNYFSLGKVNIQQLAVATSRDLVHWTHHGRIFAREAAEDMAVIPERAPWRFPHPAIVYRLRGDRFVAAKIRGKYRMYLNCLSTKGRCCLCAATSDNMLDWQVLRDEQGNLVNPLPLRRGYFDSDYIDTTAALLRDDGILLIYNGINAAADQGGDPRRRHRAHYPAQALFDKSDATRLLKRSQSPFKGGDGELERKPIVFWPAELYESWSLVPWKGELLLYWNHGFGRRSVGLWKAAIPPNVR
jgi:predicted GH43/DUF377 family glycosyl hydrolase